MLLTKKLLIYILLIISSSLSTVLYAEAPETANNSANNNEHELVTDIYDSLYKAIEMDRAYEVKQFITFGAEINYRYEGNKTPLMLASSMGSISVVKVLLELDANQYLTSKENMTALDYAQANSNKFIVAVLQTNNQSVPHNNIETENIEVVEAIATDNNTENSKVVLLKSDIRKNKGGYPDIAGTYNAMTIAEFSKCGNGNYNQTIEYYADESINKVSNNGKFKISYASPLLTCKGKGRFLKDKKNLQGKYNCSYKTEQGFRGTSRMEISGVVQDDKIHLNYKGHDTSPGVACNYSWERVITVNN